MTCEELIATLAEHPELIDILLAELEAIAKATYGSEGGLPIYDTNAAGNMRMIVLTWIARTQYGATFMASTANKLTE